ncbi:peroxisomal membrane anchor protein conserved region-domain-containing protein [Hypoxylon sp. NC1633]|nr:peroxisomal membrane anchor protein conserved region-domain-containing protein [Hypoxylon sp. NC1633]
MTDSKGPSMPSWQQPQPEKEAVSETTNPEDQNTGATDTTLDQGRKFLRDEKVRDSSVERQTEFLKSKGLDDTQIQILLKEIEEDTQALTPPSTTLKSLDKDGDSKQSSELSKEIETTTSAAPSPASDSPPIITYPEFLTKSPRPPPLITPSRLANILAVSGGIWTLLYGTARFAVSPMVDTLNDARTDYYAHVSDKAAQLVEKLEDVVSEVPYKNGKPLKPKLDDAAYEDDESTFSDPTELFHRDFGTQTSPLMLADDSTSRSTTPNQVDKSVDYQARRLAAVRASIRELNIMHVSRAEKTADLNSTLREIRDEVDKLGTPPMADFTAIHGGLGFGRTAEPNDEVRKTKDAIRSVKGMFLSTRSFPTTAAR